MNSYYIHNGTESSGPFDLEELKKRSITKTTPLWCPGMQDWKYAGDVAALQLVLQVVPPPIKDFKLVSKIEEEKIDSKIIGLDKKFFYLLIVLIALVIATSVFSFFQNKRGAAVEEKNRITDKENFQLQLQENKILEQKTKIDEKEKQDIEKSLIQRKATLNSRLVIAQEKLFISMSALEQAKDKLQKANSFKFLRSEKEKQIEISTLQDQINALNNTNIELKKEMDHITLELEKLKI